MFSRQGLQDLKQKSLRFGTLKMGVYYFYPGIIHFHNDWNLATGHHSYRSRCFYARDLVRSDL